MALEAVVKAYVRDPLAIGGNGGSIVGAFAIGERAQGAVGDAELIDFRVDVCMLGFWMTVGGNDEVLAVGGPFGAVGCPLVAAVRKIAVGDLPRRAAIRVDDEQLHVARLEITGPVVSINQPVVARRRIRPLRARWRSGQIGEVRALAGNQRGE